MTSLFNLDEYDAHELIRIRVMSMRFFREPDSDFEVVRILKWHELNHPENPICGMCLGSVIEMEIDGDLWCICGDCGHVYANISEFDRSVERQIHERIHKSGR